MSKLPAGWATARLDDIADIKGGLALGKKRQRAAALHDIPYLRVANVQRGHLNLDEIKTVEATEDEIAALLLQPGDLLLNEGGDRDKLGRGWIWEGQLPRCIHQNHVFRARLRSPDIVPQLASLYLNSLGQDYFLGQGKQTTNLASVSKSKVAAVPVVLPPAKEQRRLIAKLAAAQAHNQDARATLAEIPPLVERFRQAVLAAAFRGDLTIDWRSRHQARATGAQLLEQLRERHEICWLAARRSPSKYTAPTLKHPPADDLLARGWSEAPLDALADPVRGIPYGIVQTGEHLEKGIPTVRCGDLKDFEIGSELKLVDPRIAKDYARTELQGGEVLIAVRGTVGGTAVVPSSIRGSNISREVAMIPVLEGISPYYLMYFLASPQAKALMAPDIRGVAQRGINLADLWKLPVPVPCQDEQDAIVSFVREALQRARSIAAALANADQRTTVLAASVLAKAFRGELVPQDPNDEDARVLLERIRQEHVAVEAATAPRSRVGKKRTKAR